MKAIPMREDGSRRVKALLLLAILILTAAVYSYLPRCDFMFMDDSGYVKDNTLIKDFTPESIKKIFLSFTNEELPLVYLSFAIDYKFWGADPKFYHLENLIFHILNVLLVFIFIFFLSQQYKVALLTALLFAIHPSRVESVAWIAERKDMLYAFFYLLGLISYVLYIRNQYRIRFLLSVFLLFVLSLMSKTAALTFPFILFLVDYFLKRKISWRLFFEKTPLFLITGIALWVHSRISFVDSMGIYSIQGLNDLSSRFLMACYAFSFYIVQCFAPFYYNFANFYPMNGSSGLPLIYWLFPAFVLLFFWLVYFLV